MLSGIQHFAFCQRQWALIHIEQQWAENHLTVEGHWQHRKVDNPFAMERNKNVVHLRSVALVSHELGFYGIADILELTASKEIANTIIVPKYSGQWNVYPIEYKHGKPKYNKVDEVQLCAQAMCLEEMYSIQICEGAFYYETIRRRVPIVFTDQLRNLVRLYAEEMHELYTKGHTPKTEYQAHCRSCSLNEQCFIHPIKRMPNVKNYLKQIDEL